MIDSGSRKHLQVLGAGFALSVAASLGWLGTYEAFSGRPVLERSIALFLLPATGSVIWALISSLQRRRLPAQDNGVADAAIRDIVFWVLVFLMGMHAVMVGMLVGITWIRPWASRAVVVLGGVMLVAIGNLLPRTRPNMALGIRTSRTLTDRQLWMLTHRASGYVAVLLGALTIYSGFFLAREHIPGVPFLGFVSAAIALLAYYWKTASRLGRTPRV